MHRPLLAPFLLAPLALLPTAPLAQEGPSFDCRYAETRTEIAICASPDLARLEMDMFRSYERLVATLGEREARALADEQLARRQACEGEAACITERLLITAEVFDQRSGTPAAAEGDRPRFARLDELLRPQPRPAEVASEVAATPAPAPAPETEVASAEPAPAAPASNRPLAADAPLDLDIDLTEGAEAPEPDLSDAVDGAELASSDGASSDPDAQAAFDTPLSWAFMDLDREARQAIQERLAQAGFLDGAATGAWTNATLAALEAFAADEGSGSFDLETEPGAKLLLDYVASEAFAGSYGLEGAPPAPILPEAEAGDPLAGTNW